MQKTSHIILLLFLPVICVSLLHFSANAQQETVKINDLINSASTYDGETVTIEAEAIGECLERGDYAWVNVSDGSNAIGIWMSKEESTRITYYGDYRYTGDTLIVTGVFSRACQEHGGEPDLHCQSLSVSRVGNIREEVITTPRILAATFFASLGALLFFLHKRSHRKESNKY
jgi:hypothetical protein